MKRTIFLNILLLFVFVIAKGQDYIRNDVCAPKGSNVVAWQSVWDFSDSLKQAYDAHYATTYPNVEILTTNGIYSSTKEFNCHGYAWHVSDGGGNRWIGLDLGNTDEHIYWTENNGNGSYTEVANEVHPGKVSYSSDDHSAITTNKQGWFISKWGNKVLARHRWNDCPYTSSNLKYYKLNFPITGPNAVCTSNSTFTINPPTGASVSWAVSPSSLVTPSSGSGSSATFHLYSCNNTGNAQITFTLSNPCGGTASIQVTKEFVAGGPSDVSLVVKDNQTGQEVDPMFMCPNTLYVLYCENYTSCYTSNYSWTLPYEMTQISASQNWVLINTNTSPGGILMVHGQTCCTDCGSNVLILTETLQTGGYNCGGGWYMSFTPNPATEETTLELKTDNIENYSEDDEWEMEIYNQQQVLINKTTGLKDKKHLINTSGWTEGIYFVRVMMKDNIYFGKLVVSR